MNDLAQRLHGAALDHLIGASPPTLADTARRLAPTLKIRDMVTAIEWLEEPGVTAASIGPWLEARAREAPP